MAFYELFEGGNRETVRIAYQKVTTLKEEVSMELSLMNPGPIKVINNANEGTTRIFFQALPQLDSFGNVTKIIGCMTDISNLKWMQSVTIPERGQPEMAMAMAPPRIVAQSTC
jgi:hypothetical protein